MPPTFYTGAYGYFVSNLGFVHPQSLSEENGTLYSKPTTEYFGFYTDKRAAMPMARVTLPGKVRYMKYALGMSLDYDGIGLISEIIYKGKANREDRSSGENSVGADRNQTPIAEGFYLPELMSVPLRSNRHTYGPYLPTFSNYIAGKTEVEVDTNLAPENFVIPGFGLGYTGMDYFGYAKALPDNVGYFCTEGGSFTLAGIPKTNLGESLIVGGPYLTDINISFSPNGYTTTFAMKTWNLDFGRLKKHFLDRIMQLSDRGLRLTKQYSNRISLAQDFQREIRFPERVRSHSSSSIIAGIVESSKRMKNIDGVETVKEIKTPSISIMPAHNFISTVKKNYEKVGACSLDALFVPFSCDSTAEDIPKMLENTNISFGTQKQLNPLLPFGAKLDTEFVEDGTTIQMFTRGSELPDDLNIKSALYLDSFEDDPLGSESLNVRGIANKTPSVTVGYGYDVHGNKVPSTNSKFDIYNANNWKAGPDLKVWDDERGIWIGGFPILKGLLLEDMVAGTIASPTSVKILRIITNNVLEGETLKSGESATSDTREVIFCGEHDLICEDGAFTDADRGSLVYYLNIDGENVPIYVSCFATNESLSLIQEYENE